MMAVVAALGAAEKCRFAPEYDRGEIATRPSVRREFLDRVLKAEARFMRELGMDPTTGLTVTDVLLDTKTGLPLPKAPSVFWDPEDEAVHIAVLTKSLTSAKDKVYSEIEALAILTKKLSHLFISGSPRFQKALKGLKAALE